MGLTKNRITVWIETQYDNYLAEAECTGCFDNFRRKGMLLCVTCRFNKVIYRVNLLKTGYNIYDNDNKFEKHLIKRQELMTAHEKGKLSKSWYKYKPNGQRYLSPDKLREQGF